MCSSPPVELSQHEQKKGWSTVNVEEELLEHDIVCLTVYVCVRVFVCVCV